jgi:hypothetical protein
MVQGPIMQRTRKYTVLQQEQAPVRVPAGM